MDRITVYTDGGCSGNPGPGGWAFVLLDKDNIIKYSGGDKNTTNNRMELTAVIKALEYISSDKRIREMIPVIHTDSAYVKNGITSWINTWVDNGWKTASRQPVKNRELWQELKVLNESLSAEWKWVKGHSGNEYNEMCDSLVKDEMYKLTGKNGNPDKKSKDSSFSLNNRKFRSVENSDNGEVSGDTVFSYYQKGRIVWAEYSGGSIIMGHLIGIIDGKNNLDFRYHHINNCNEIMTGKCRSVPEILENGKIRYHEKWQWTCSDRSSGTSIIEEI